MAEIAISQKAKRMNIRRNHAGLAIFFLPSFVFYGVFKYFPIIYSGVLSFAKWNFIKEISWVGIQNYTSMFGKKMFLIGIGNTFKYVLAFLPFFLIVPLALAVLIIYIRNRQVQTAFKSLLFLPSILALSICCLVWQWIYAPSFGILNRLISNFGGSNIPWLSDKKYALNAVVIVCSWKYMGQNMILFMAGLLNISNDCIEAARIDGANEWQCFWQIRFPLIMPTFIYLFITAVIFAADRSFTAINILTQGGPNYTTTNLAHVIYEFAFRSYNIGMASSIAVFTSVFYLIITLVMMKVLGGLEYHE